MARWFADLSAGAGLLAVTSDDGLVVAHGQYIPDGKGSAEVAFAVTRPSSATSLAASPHASR
ncbi:MAG: hypothetical protein ABW135_11545 [Thermoleophilaceae bacterium]